MITRRKFRRYVKEAVRNGSLSYYQAEVVLADNRCLDYARFHKGAGYDDRKSMERGISMILYAYKKGMMPMEEAPF